VNALIAWIRSKNITSHTVAVASIALATIITTDQQVRDFILGLFKDHPAIGSDIVLLAGVILKYAHSSSPAGAVAESRAVLAKPDAPTAAQVDAATTK
jgi:hypothetical protein